MRRLTSLLSGLILSMGLFYPTATPAVADQPAVSQSGPTEDVSLPIYQPPKKLTPRARVGGGLRGMDGNDPVIEALVPDHVGFTVKKTPVLNWFISKPTTYQVIFTLNHSRLTKPIFEGPIPSPVHAGIQSIDLKDMGPCIGTRRAISLVHLRDYRSKIAVEEYCGRRHDRAL